MSARAAPVHLGAQVLVPTATPVSVRALPSPLHERYLGLCIRIFGGLSRPSAQKADKLRQSIEQAHLEILPEAYLALVWANVAFATLATYALAVLLLAASFVGGFFPPVPIVVVLLVMPLVIGGTTFVAQMVYPDYRAGERRRAIDRDIPYAVNFIAAMASAGVVPATLLRDLAREKTYGEVAREVAWLVRDIDLLGLDILTAIQRATGRTPSHRFREFLQGAKTTILSGGDLKAYFLAKADQYMSENRRLQKDFLGSLGLMAESYVTVVIAGPLFMLVMLSIMLLIGNSGAASEAFLFMLTFVMLPLAHATFAWIIRSMAPEA